MKISYTCFVTTVLACASSVAESNTNRAILSSARQTAPAAATVQSSSNAVPYSVFVVPRNPQEGRDPFFPNSTRLTKTTESTNKPQRSVSSNVPLVLQGISGTTSQRLAIINGRTLAESEGADITIGDVRIHVRCVEIKSDSVIVEVANVRRELRMRAAN
jgi:hypothetical protein